MSVRVFTNLSSILVELLHQSSKKKNSSDVHFWSQLNAPPPEFPIGSKYLAAGWIYIYTTNICSQIYRIHTPWSVLGTGETVHSSMPQGTLLYPAYICHEPPARRDCPHIHAKHNIVIILHIVGRLWSPLYPYAMGHCQPPCFHGLWNIRARYCDRIWSNEHGTLIVSINRNCTKC